MGENSGFPIDLILFGMIAAFLVLRLRSILGRRDGFEQQRQMRQPGARPNPIKEGAIIEGRAEPVPPPTPDDVAEGLPDPASPVGQTLMRMKLIDPDFSPGQFLQGAATAFRMIVDAFATGKRDVLRPLLSDETYHTFEGAIAAREVAGDTQHTEIRALKTPQLEGADLRDTLAHLTVRFVSDQVTRILDREGKPVTPSDAMVEITDIWTFERDLTSHDPAWRLSAATSG
jgi:predicted lipid-binding transport protein (Tim44 family)